MTTLEKERKDDELLWMMDLGRKPHSPTLLTIARPNEYITKETRIAA